MPTNDRRRGNDPVNEIAPDANDRPEDGRRRCPACNTPVESVRDVGPVTWALEPCGHQVDDRIHADVWAVDLDSGG